MVKKLFLSIFLLGCFSLPAFGMEGSSYQPQVYVSSDKLELHRSVSTKDLTGLRASLGDSADNSLYINLRSSNDCTPLELAITTGFAEGIQPLLENGAAPAIARESDGCNAFHIAAAYGTQEITHLLMVYAQFPQTNKSLHEAAQEIKRRDENERGVLLGRLAKNLTTQHIGLLKRVLAKTDKHQRTPQAIALKFKKNLAPFFDPQKVEAHYKDAVEQRYINDLTMAVT